MQNLTKSLVCALFLALVGCSHYSDFPPPPNGSPCQSVDDCGDRGACWQWSCNGGSCLSVVSPDLDNAGQPTTCDMSIDGSPGTCHAGQCDPNNGSTMQCFPAVPPECFPPADVAHKKQGSHQPFVHDKYSRTDAAIIWANPSEWGASEHGRFVALLAGQKTITVRLFMEHGCTLDGVSVVVIGSGGHGSLPEHMPTVDIVRSDVESADLEWLATGQDESKTIDVYQAAHSIDVPVANVAIDGSTSEYHAIVRNEHGMHAMNGLTYVGLRHHCMPTM